MARFIPFLFVIALVFGASYAAALINAAMGPWQAVGIEHDGSQTHMQFGRDLPRPQWVPVYPGAVVVQGSKLTSVKAPSGFHSLEISVRASLDEVKQFYTRELAATGFAVTDPGLAPLNPATAAFLGIAGSLQARRSSTDDQITVQIRTAEGLFPSRLLQIHWNKISEFPAHAAPRPRPDREHGPLTGCGPRATIGAHEP
jgi:hypothetical protein